MTSYYYLPDTLPHRLLTAVVVLALGFSFVVTERDDTHGKCDVVECLSPQLSDAAAETKDRKTICRLLTPSLHCLETKLPACRKAIGADSPMYHAYEKQLANLQIQYADKCNAIYTTCTEFAKCLLPEIQKAAHHHDITSLCKTTPLVISCFESAIDKCEEETGYRDTNFDLIESKLDQLRHQTSAKCTGTSTTAFTNTTLPMMVLTLAVLLGQRVQYFLTVLHSLLLT